jgi:hypothetical protein
MAAEETVTIRIVIEIVTGDPHAGIMIIFKIIPKSIHRF